jgi:hypothetical protein
MVNLTLQKINYFVDKRDIKLVDCTNNITPFLYLYLQWRPNDQKGWNLIHWFKPAALLYLHNDFVPNVICRGRFVVLNGLR